jgi:hypothetical protein
MIKLQRNSFILMEEQFNQICEARVPFKWQGLSSVTSAKSLDLRTLNLRFKRIEECRQP